MDNPSFRDVAGAPVTGTSSAQATTYRRVFTTKRTLALLFLLVLFVWLSWAVWRALATDKQFPGLGEVINWLSPYEWASLGVAFSLGLSVLGAGCGIIITGSSLIGASVRVPRVKNKNLLSILFCEAAAIYGIIMALMLTTRLSRVDNYSYATYYTGYAYFWAGLTVGLCDLICGIVVGLIGSGVVLADAVNPQSFVRVLVVEIFASAIGLLGLVIGFAQIATSEDFSKGNK